MKSYLGLDLSLSSTGFFLLREDGSNRNMEIRTEGGNYTCLVRRVKDIAETILKQIEKEDVVLVLMEDFYVGRFATPVIGLAALGTIVRDRLSSNGYSYITATPSQIKKFESGSGTSQKGAMIKNVFKNHRFDTSSDNIADACAASFLCRGYVEWKLGRKDFLKYQIDVLKGMKTPIEYPYNKSERKQGEEE